MMSKIKQALVFLCGMIYASSIWCLAMYPAEDGELAPLWQMLPSLIVLLGGVAIACAVIAFFIDHWNEA